MPRKSKSPSGLRRFLRRLFWTGVILLALAATFVGLANWHIIRANRTRLHDDLASIPPTDVALVLGTSPFIRRGVPNLHFEGRMNAAAKLYAAGKVKHVLVSGDNRHRTYNEPVEMRAALIKRGVPSSAITLDFAGFRTLDSVVRARKIFGLERVIIVTQRYHNSRALAIARAHGLDARGYCAPDVAFAHSFVTECREVLARTLTVLDLHVLHRQPYFLGQPEPIQVTSGGPI